MGNIVQAISLTAKRSPALAERLQATEAGIAVEEGELNRLGGLIAAEQAKGPTEDEYIVGWCNAMRDELAANPALLREFLRAVVVRIDVPAEGPLVLHHHLLRPGTERTPAPGGARGSNKSPFVLIWRTIQDQIRAREVG